MNIIGHSMGHQERKQTVRSN